MTAEGTAPHEGGIADPLLARIADFAHSLSVEQISQPAVRAAKERLIDSLGCALGALARPEGCEPAEIGRRVAALPAREELRGRIVASRSDVAGDSAAFVNSCLIRYLDFNDTYPGHHPSDCLGALLAIAPSTGARAGDLIAAMVVSYEISLRLLMATRLNRKGWDNGYSVGIATAAGASRLMGLDADALRHAIAITATANVPMRATRAGNLSMWKGAATAYAVQNAVRSVHLAREGMTGPEAPFTGRHGLVDLITGPIELDPFPTEGGDFYIPRAKMKYWPVAYNIQPLVWLGIELRQQLAGRTLAEVEVFTNWSSWRESGSEPAKWDPRTRETADHSGPYILAWTLRHGSIDHGAFEPESFLDASFRTEMAKIRVSVDDEIEQAFPEVIRMRLSARDTEGGTYDLQVENVLGHEDNPMSEDDIATKFRHLATPILGEAGALTAFQHWWDLAPDDDVNEALDHMLAGEGPA